MPDTIDVAEYKAQVFGNGQSNTHTPTPPPTNEVLDPEPKPTTPAEVGEAIADPTSVITSPTEEDEIVDADEYVSKQLGVKDWNEAKAALAELVQLREAAKTSSEIKYANEQSKAVAEALQAGKLDEVYEILDTQRKVSAVQDMQPDEALKLHISITNKNFKAIDVEDVFEEKYSYPEKPEQRLDELDTEFEQREEKWKGQVEKINRRIERDASVAKIELQKLSAELKFPDIPKPVEITAQNAEDVEKETYRIHAEIKEAYSKLSTKDLTMVFKFNDEASKLAFDIQYEPDEESFEKLIASVSTPSETYKEYFDKDGNPKRVDFARDLYAGRNIHKIVSEAIVQAVNQERIRALKVQKNIGEFTQRNYVTPPMSDIDKLRQQVFG